MSAGMFQAVISEQIGLWHEMSLNTVLSLTSVGLNSTSVYGYRVRLNFGVQLKFDSLENVSGYG